jgi:peroxiredoxin
MKSQKTLDAQAPKAGDLAPDFTLSDISGTESVTLSDFRGKKPVALVFGSYT